MAFDYPLPVTGWQMKGAGCRVRGTCCGVRVFGGSGFKGFPAFGDAGGDQGSGFLAWRIA
jgi:hypothetical protein